MKIAFVCDAIYPYHRGGRETRLYEISTRLAKLGHEVHILTMNWWDGKKIKQENGVTLHGICKVKKIYTKQGIRSIWSAIYFSLNTFWPLLKSEYDIVDVDHMPFFQLYSARLALWMKNKKMLATWHEVWGKKYWQSYLGNFKGIIAYSIERVAPLLPNKILSVSELTTSRLIDRLNTTNKKISTINTGIDFQKINNTNSIANKSDIIYIGRLISHKNVNLLIDVVKKIKTTIPKVKCNIIGQGPEFNSLKEKITKENLANNINLLGYIPDQEAYSYLKASKIFISLSTREGFGISVLETQAAGLPAIIVNHPDNASTNLIKNNRNGLIAENNFDSIYDSVITLLQNEQERLKMKKQAINNAAGYDWVKVISKIEKYYLSAIENL